MRGSDIAWEPVVPAEAVDIHEVSVEDEDAEGDVDGQELEAGERAIKPNTHFLNRMLDGVTRTNRRVIDINASKAAEKAVGASGAASIQPLLAHAARRGEPAVRSACLASAQQQKLTLCTALLKEVAAMYGFKLYLTGPTAVCACGAGINAVMGATAGTPDPDAGASDFAAPDPGKHDGNDASGGGMAAHETPEGCVRLEPLVAALLPADAATAGNRRSALLRLTRVAGSAHTPLNPLPRRSSPVGAAERPKLNLAGAGRLTNSALSSVGLLARRDAGEAGSAGTVQPIGRRPSLDQASRASAPGTSDGNDKAGDASDSSPANQLAGIAATLQVSPANSGMAPIDSAQCIVWNPNRPTGSSSITSAAAAAAAAAAREGCGEASLTTLPPTSVVVPAGVAGELASTTVAPTSSNELSTWLDDAAQPSLAVATVLVDCAVVPSEMLQGTPVPHAGGEAASGEAAGTCSGMSAAGLTTPVAAADFASRQCAANNSMPSSCAAAAVAADNDLDDHADAGAVDAGMVEEVPADVPSAKAHVGSAGASRSKSSKKRLADEVAADASTSGTGGSAQQPQLGLARATAAHSATGGGAAGSRSSSPACQQALTQLQRKRHGLFGAAIRGLKGESASMQ